MFIKEPTKGMRDILPAEMEIREYLLNKLKKTYASFGFSQIETPCVEHIENLTNKQGGENEKLIFKVMKRGEKLAESLEGASIDELVDSGLRYDLTVPLSRYYASNSANLNLPFKAMQTGSVWRADRPQKGRYRQFTQCDIDILGDPTNAAEIELICATSTFLAEVGVNGCTVMINDRRILSAMARAAGFPEEEFSRVFIILDKFDKIGEAGIEKELNEANYDAEAVAKYMEIFRGVMAASDRFAYLLEAVGGSIEEGVIENIRDICESVATISEGSINLDSVEVRLDEFICLEKSKYRLIAVVSKKLAFLGNSLGIDGVRLDRSRYTVRYCSCNDQRNEKFISACHIGDKEDRRHWSLHDTGHQTSHADKHEILLWHHPGASDKIDCPGYHESCDGSDEKSRTECSSDSAAGISERHREHFQQKNQHKEDRNQPCLIKEEVKDRLSLQVDSASIQEFLKVYISLSEKRREKEDEDTEADC